MRLSAKKPSKNWEKNHDPHFTLLSLRFKFEKKRKDKRKTLYWQPDLD